MKTWEITTRSGTGHLTFKIKADDFYTSKSFFAFKRNGVTFAIYSVYTILEIKLVE